jgi:hypothetical protein
LLEYDAFDILARNTKELARRTRLESGKKKFRRAVQRLRTTTMLKGMAAAVHSMETESRDDTSVGSAAPTTASVRASV